MNITDFFSAFAHQKRKEKRAYAEVDTDSRSNGTCLISPMKISFAYRPNRSKQHNFVKMYRRNKTIVMLLEVNVTWDKCKFTVNKKFSKVAEMVK